MSDFRPMYKQELKELKSKLEEVRRVSTMEGTSFEDITKATHVVIPEGEVNDFIRERTRVWRESWLLHPLDVMINRIEDCLEGVSAEQRAERERQRKYGS